MRTMQIEELIHKPNAELLYEWFKNHEPDEEYADLLDKAVEENRNGLKLG